MITVNSNFVNCQVKKTKQVERSSNWKGECVCGRERKHNMVVLTECYFMARKENSVQCIVTPADSLLTVFLSEKQDKKFHFPHNTEEWFACNDCGLCMVLWSVRERCMAQYRWLQLSRFSVGVTPPLASGWRTCPGSTR